MMLIEHLQKNHNVRLITDKKVDFGKLNEKFGTSANPVHVIRPLFVRIVGKIEPHLHLFAKLQTALLASYLRKNNHIYELCISTKMEANFGERGMQFLHHEPEGMKSRVYDGAYLWLLSYFGRKKEGIEKNITISPSTYIKNLYEKVYDAKSYVVYPAIYKHQNSVTFSWDNKEDGFLVIGHIDELKRTHIAIEIIDELSRQGFDTHLHIIGTGSGLYYDKIKNMRDTRETVTLEGFVSKEKYAWLIASHKYVIHPRINEPSAVAIREAIDGGCIVFAHESGGNPEILGYNKHLLFTSTGQAVEKIKNVLMNEDIQHGVCMDLDSLSFNTRENYLREIDDIIAVEFKGKLVLDMLHEKGKVFVNLLQDNT